MNRIATWLLGPYQFRVVLLGSGAGGKTTFLYRLKCDAVVNAIPTVGCNIETFRYPHNCEWTIFDNGETGRIPLWKHYHTKDAIVLWFHDLEDTLYPHQADFLHYNVEDMLNAGSNELWIVVNKQDILFPENSYEVIRDLRQAYEREMARYGDKVNWRFVDRKISAKTGEGIWEVLDDIYASRVGPTRAPRGEPVL